MMDVEVKKDFKVSVSTFLDLLPGTRASATGFKYSQVRLPTLGLEIPGNLRIESGRVGFRERRGLDRV